jgi:hypothetical protein
LPPRGNELQIYLLRRLQAVFRQIRTAAQSLDINANMQLLLLKIINPIYPFHRQQIESLTIVDEAVSCQ